MNSTIERAYPDTVADVVGWAEQKGWNPGLGDATAFHAADPAGFLLRRVDGLPAAAVSMVNHSPEFPFPGLYLQLR